MSFSFCIIDRTFEEVFSLSYPTNSVGIIFNSENIFILFAFIKTEDCLDLFFCIFITSINDFLSISKPDFVHISSVISIGKP